MKAGKYFFLMLAMLPLFFLISTTNHSFAAPKSEEMPISITLRTNWFGCDGNCDHKQSGNHTNSGSYTIHIKGSVIASRGGRDAIIYEPKNLTAKYTVQSTTTDIGSSDCQKCNPVETITGTSSVAFGKAPDTIATVQAFMGALGAGFALQLAGELGPGYEKTVPAMKDRRIISFNATAPVQMTRASVDNCKSCAKNSEPLTSGFGISVNADMTTRKKGSVSWKSKDHPLDTMGAGVIDLGKIVSPKNDPQGKAQYSLTWSLGEAEPALLKLKEVHFNYDGNTDSAVTLIKHSDEQKIKAPEWTATGERKSAAFIRNKLFKARALFCLEGKRIEKAEIWAEEEVEGKQGAFKKGFEGLKKTMVEFAEGETEKEVEFTIHASQAAISINNVRWRWMANIWYRGSAEPETDVVIKTDTPEEADASEHTIYIVGDQPVAKAKPYEFAVKKGCQWAEGLQSKDDAFQAIWKSFGNIECPADSSCLSGVLSYEHGDSPVTTSGLLNQGRGKCGAWQVFFADVVGSQGISVDLITVKPKPDQNINTMMVCSRPAQGNLQPKRIFTDHAIIKYNERFYDPSYHFDLQASADEPISLYENETFEAYCKANTVDTIINTILCMATCGNKETDDEYYRCLARECECRKNHPLECEVTTEN